MTDIAEPVAGDAHPDLEHHPGEHIDDKKFVQLADPEEYDPKFKK